MHINEQEKLSLVPSVFALEMRQDDPRKCTSAKMIRLGLARRLFGHHIPRGSIVLDPTASHYLMEPDKDSALAQGLVVVDCSWVKAESVFNVVARSSNFGRHDGRRKLPLLLAGNPTNYAMAGKLSSLEAVAAALFIMGFKEAAKKFLSIYKWGETFLSLNLSALEDYSKVHDEQGVKKVELEYFPHLSERPRF